MTAITFDTLRYAKKLEEKGFSTEQAEALTELQSEVFNEALENELATKADIQRLEQSIAEVKNEFSGLRSEFGGLKSGLESEMKLIKWMLALIIVVAVIPVLKGVFG
jgi:DNA-binding transcriptional MerR regulator